MGLRVTLLLLLTKSAVAATLSGKVISVPEGDLIVVKDAKKVLHHVRLFATDAPEKSQPFFWTSQERLYRILIKKKVTVEWHKLEPSCKAGGDPKCPKLGKVFFDGIDINLGQVLRGLAWHDERAMGEQSTPDRTLYIEAHEEAKRKKRGLWKSRKPVPPWEFPRQPSSVKPKKKR